MDSKSSKLKLILLFLAALLQTQSGEGARILASFFFPGKSHFMMTNAIVRELIARGHEVTFITPFSLAKENLGKNYTEVLIPQYEFWSDLQRMTDRKSVIDMSDVSAYTFFRLCAYMGVKSSDFAFEQQGVKDLINAKDKIGKFDLLLAEEFYNEPALVFGKLYEIPIITISTFGYSNYMSSLTGIVLPWSYVPHAYMPLTDRMTLLERFSNAIMSLKEDLYRHFIYYPEQNEVLRKHFSHLPGGAPTVYDFHRNTSAMLLNNYVPLITTRPTSFNMVPVGGVHITPPKPLPKNIAKFLDEAKHGAIYFSLGTQVRSADMSAEKLAVFLNVFGRLKQRVLWKFEDENLPNLPANVMVQNWMPQNDILAHPNVKVFITHGGLFGTQEAVHYGVPLLGIPVYCDQHLNINKGKQAGYALGLDYRTITEKDLEYSLTELLENPKYQLNMKRASHIFRDRPLSAMDTAMYWIDYVIAHRGAPHMVAAGLDLPWYQFYLLDILLISLLLVIAPIFGIKCLVVKLFCNKKNAISKTKTTSKKKRNAKKVN